MEAIPAHSRESTTPLVTGTSCPDCPGVLVVRALHVGGTLHFRCRIGHAYSEDELLAAKEERVESHLWAAVTAFEELAALLADLDRAPDRRARALRAVQALRQIIDQDRPIVLEVPGADGVVE